MDFVFLCRCFKLRNRLPPDAAAAVAVAAHSDGNAHAASAASPAGAIFIILIFIVASRGMWLIWRWNAEGVVEIPVGERSFFFSIVRVYILV